MEHPSARLALLSLALFFVLSTSLPGAFASDCKGGEVLGVGCWICGKAVNKTPWQMLYTTDPGGACGKKCCQVLNWEDGDGSFNDAFNSKPASKLVACSQDPMASGDSKGGNTCTKKNRLDVDAITFADRDFVVATVQSAGKGGSTMREVKVGYGPRDRVRVCTADSIPKVTKGVWIKISSAETITCRERNGKPYCT